MSCLMILIKNDIKIYIDIKFKILIVYLFLYRFFGKWICKIHNDYVHIFIPLLWKPGKCLFPHKIMLCNYHVNSIIQFGAIHHLFAFFASLLIRDPQEKPYYHLFDVFEVLVRDELSTSSFHCIEVMVKFCRCVILVVIVVLDLLSCCAHVLLPPHDVHLYVLSCVIPFITWYMSV